ncbi:unnamed protein product [Linum tenue]|uniref:Uncharacterized protein n=1 Tax=Linum tenue TaxID=586396 RepID=A0AAV0MDN1_9ROSI|nr:unnamed protein product [Linum tenue]
MILQSSSTPALKNLVGHCCVVPEIDASLTSHVSPKYSPFRHAPTSPSLKWTSSEGDLKLFSSNKGKSKKQPKEGTNHHHYSKRRPPSPSTAIVAVPALSRTAPPLQRTSLEGDPKLGGGEFHRSRRWSRREDPAAEAREGFRTAARKGLGVRCRGQGWNPWTDITGI